jgi:hypothetical protein
MSVSFPEPNKSAHVPKWSINQYYTKKLLNGEAVQVNDPKNPGSGEYDIDVNGLTQLQKDHGENMSPLQIVACFILQHIRVLTYENLVPGLMLTKHHGVPVADDCNRADM